VTLMKEIKKNHGDLTKENVEAAKRLDGEILKQDLGNKQTLEGKQDVLDRELARDRKDEEKLKALQKKWQSEKLEAEVQSDSKLREKLEAEAAAQEQQLKKAADVS
jgi:hypothetical protein